MAMLSEGFEYGVGIHGFKRQLCGAALRGGAHLILCILWCLALSGCAHLILWGLALRGSAHLVLWAVA